MSVTFTVTVKTPGPYVWVNGPWAPCVFVEAIVWLPSPQLISIAHGASFAPASLKLKVNDVWFPAMHAVPVPPVKVSGETTGDALFTATVAE